MRGLLFYGLMLLFPAAVADSSRGDVRVECRLRASFTSEGSVGAEVAEAIRQTKSRLHLALYGFNNRKLADELAKLAKRGVAVCLKVGASKGAENKTARIIKTLRAAGVDV